MNRTPHREGNCTFIQPNMRSKSVSDSDSGRRPAEVQQTFDFFQDQLPHNSGSDISRLQAGSMIHFLTFGSPRKASQLLNSSSNSLLSGGVTAVMVAQVIRCGMSTSFVHVVVLYHIMTRDVLSVFKFLSSGRTGRMLGSLPRCQLA